VATVETNTTKLNEDAELVALFGRTKTESGKTLLSLLDEKPMLLIFLRHFGCSFCREAIADVAKAMPELDRRGVRPVFVHMGTPERARPFFERFRIPEVERVSDPKMTLYQSSLFRLLKTVVLPEYFGFDSILKWAQRPLLKYGVGTAHGEDKTQLPGVFFLRDRAIVKGYRHKKLADRPDYVRLGS
jgi:peroxiredoxin